MEELNEYKEELVNQFQELKEIAEAERMIQNNMIEFQIKEELYRVRRPVYSEQVEAEKFINERKVEMLRDPKCATREELKNLWKQKGMDIDDMDRKMVTLQAEINNLRLQLAETTEKKAIKMLEEDIIKLMHEQTSISVDKANLLSCSLEDQLTTEANIYCMYLLLDKKEEGEWKRAFGSFERFQAEIQNEVVIQANYYLNVLLFSSETGIENEESK